MASLRTHSPGETRFHQGLWEGIGEECRHRIYPDSPWLTTLGPLGLGLSEQSCYTFPNSWQTLRTRTWIALHTLTSISVHTDYLRPTPDTQRNKNNNNYGFSHNQWVEYTQYHNYGLYLIYSRYCNMVSISYSYYYFNLVLYILYICILWIFTILWGIYVLLLLLLLLFYTWRHFGTVTDRTAAKCAIPSSLGPSSAFLTPILNCFACPAWMWLQVATLKVLHLYKHSVWGSVWHGFPHDCFSYNLGRHSLSF